MLNCRCCARPRYWRKGPGVRSQWVCVCVCDRGRVISGVVSAFQRNLHMKRSASFLRNHTVSAHGACVPDSVSPVFRGWQLICGTRKCQKKSAPSWLTNLSLYMHTNARTSYLMLSLRGSSVYLQGRIKIGARLLMSCNLSGPYAAARTLVGFLQAGSLHILRLMSVIIFLLSDQQR